METEKDTCTRPKWMTKLLGCSNHGGISSQQLPNLLTKLSPGLNVDENVLNRIVSQNDPTGSGVLDFDTVTKIVFQLILKQPCKEDEEEAYNQFKSSIGIPEADSDCTCATPVFKDWHESNIYDPSLAIMQNGMAGFGGQIAS